MKNVKSFYLVLFSVWLLPLIIIVCFNFIIDPYDIFAHHLINLDREHKTEVFFHQRLTKTNDINLTKPKAIILGSSKVMEGFDTADLEKMTGDRWYNLGLSGANMEEIRAYFEHVLFIQPHLKKVIIGIDLFAFNSTRTPQPDFATSRLKRASIPLKETTNNLLTFDALKSSLKTLQESHTTQIILDKNGNILFHNMMQYILEQNLSFVDWESAILKPYFQSSENYASFQLSSKAIEDFIAIADKCEEKGILFYPFFCPSKAIYWQGLHQIGIWEDLENLKKILVMKAPIWDFSGCNKITTEPFEEHIDSNYFDSAHFKPTIGCKIASIMFNMETKEEIFGTIISPSNIDEHLASLKKKQISWAKENPTIIEFLNKRCLAP
jgi:hypothetical protein